MALEQKPFLKNRIKKKVKSLSLDKDNLLKFCNILQERAHSAAEIEEKKFPRGEESPEEYDNKITTLKECFILKITIVGNKGEELFGNIEEVFNSVNFPEDIVSFYVNSETTLKALHNYFPQNSFELFLILKNQKCLTSPYYQASAHLMNQILKCRVTTKRGFMAYLAKFLKF